MTPPGHAVPDQSDKGAATNSAMYLRNATLHYIATLLIWIAFQGAAISRALCCGRIATLLQASLECDTIYTGISITNVPQKYAGVYCKIFVGHCTPGGL